jgi:large subunit ribosomal protein L22
MEAKANANFVRVSPRKAAQMTDLIRGKKVVEAITLLKFSQKAAGEVVGKVLKSAVANSKQKNIENLKVKEAYVGYGPTMKRMRAMAMGRGAVVRKRLAHITIVVTD